MSRNSFIPAMVIFAVLFCLNTGPTYAQEGLAIMLTADFSETVGQIKPVNGTNLGPRLVTSRYNGQRELFNNARFGLVRLHDAPWDNPGLRLVDMHLIFGNMNDDPADPANYYFDATDDYIKTIIDGGAPIMYRLGVSIEHSAPNTYFAKEPEDVEKAGEIFAGIIRHYNRGWADGFNYGIEYWEIWNEPNMVPLMWDDRDFSSYCRFYVKTAKRLKEEFPEIKVGGPALAGCDEKLLAQFIDFCRKENAPLDFCSWHAYPSSFDEIMEAPVTVRRLLDERGFAETELHLDEWHYFNTTWDIVQGLEGGRDAHRDVNHGDGGINGIDSAAFIACALALWQDTPLDSANYYCTSLLEDDWGLMDINSFPYKTYYVFRGFGEMRFAAPKRIRCGKAPANFVILGGAGENGQKRLMVASFGKKAESLKVRLSGVPASGTARVASIDAGERIEPAESAIGYTNGVLELGPISGSTVKFIELP